MLPAFEENHGTTLLSFFVNVKARVLSLSLSQVTFQINATSGFAKLNPKGENMRESSEAKMCSKVKTQGLDVRKHKEERRKKRVVIGAIFFPPQLVAVIMCVCVFIFKFLINQALCLLLYIINELKD